MHVELNDVVTKRRMRNVVLVLSLLVSATLLLLPSALKLDGKAHADWQQFLGRFHPLVVHLPISLILLVPAFEIAGRYRPALREAAGVMLGLSVLSCLGAVTLGYLLAYGSGEAGASITRHMWSGLLLTILVLLCSLIRPLWASGRLPGVYPSLLACVLLLMAWAAHQGGSLTHGDNYLTQYLPPTLKRLASVGVLQTKAAPTEFSFYTAHIHPILDANCVACHGQTKVKGGLRVDSYSLLMDGGTSGPVIVPGKPEQSILLSRVTLPFGHEKSMPSGDRPALKPQEIAWIRAWILQGASPTVTSLAGVTLPDTAKETAVSQVGDYTGLSTQIAQLERSEGVTLTPVSRHAGDGLILNTINTASTFDDARLAHFDKLAPYIVEVQLSRTRVTDDCFTTLAKFSQLRALHLENTSVTGDGLAKLSRLTHLTYINLSGTEVTRAALAPLASMSHLQHIYLYNTPAQPITAVSANSIVLKRSL